MSNKCELCGTEHDGKYGSGRFCSQKCSRSFSTKNDKPKPKTATCSKCGKIFEANKRSRTYNVMCNECKHPVRAKKEIIDPNFKKCLMCKQILPLSRYYTINKKSKKLYSYCKKCWNKYTTNKNRDLKIKCVEHCGGKCEICNKQYNPEVFDFHHKSEKGKNISLMIDHHFS